VRGGGVVPGGCLCPCGLGGHRWRESQPPGWRVEVGLAKAPARSFILGRPRQSEDPKPRPENTRTNDSRSRCGSMKVDPIKRPGSGPGNEPLSLQAGGVADTPLPNPVLVVVGSPTLWSMVHQAYEHFPVPGRRKTQYPGWYHAPPWSIYLPRTPPQIFVLFPFCTLRDPRRRHPPLWNPNLKISNRFLARREAGKDLPILPGKTPSPGPWMPPKIFKTSGKFVKEGENQSRKGLVD
jgi:hypothetical protein